MIIHHRENVDEQRGVLLEQWTGEVVPGDMIDVNPTLMAIHQLKDQANVGSYTLLLDCQNRFDGVIDGNLGTHQAVFNIPTGRGVFVAGDHSQWHPSNELQIRWSSAVTPELRLDFVLILHLHTAPRYAPIGRDFTGNSTSEAPRMLGIMLSLSWWVQPRKTNYLGGVL